MAEEHADELMVAHLDGRMRAEQPAGAQQPGAAYAALPDADRDYMRKVVAVAVTMLFDGYKEDVTRVFSTGELSEFVTITAAMGGERVEGIYRRAWDLLSLPVRASHGQAPATLQSGEQPLPLLVKDIAADLATTPIQVCMALSALGFGGHSVNMAVTPTMAQALRAHFSATEQAAPAAAGNAVVGCNECHITHDLGACTTAAPAAVAGPSQETCQTCQGNGEVITDWERYKHPLPGDVGDEAVAECQDCDGQGTVDAAPTTQPAPHPVDEFQPCPSCFGTGVEGDADDYGHTIDVTCGDCNGSGRAQGTNATQPAHQQEPDEIRSYAAARALVVRAARKQGANHD